MMRTTGQRVLDWYWKYVDVYRETQYAIPLDSLSEIMDITDRQQALDAGRSGKSCVAFWGPSGSGKSSFLARYLDGEKEDGSDGSLSWGEEMVRFSADESRAGLVVFNPFNTGMDASGLATRFVLRKDVEDERYPVELKITSLEQLLLATAVGYRCFCRLEEQKVIPANLEREIDNGTPAQADRDSFELMHVFCRVCHVLAKHYREEFQHFDKLSSKLMGSRYVENREVAWKLIGSVLWRGNSVLTGIIEELCHFKKTLGDRRIFAAMSVAAELEDIELHGGKDYYLSETKDGRLTVGQDFVPGATKISRGELKKLQILVEEMRVPVKEDAIRNEMFRKFLASNDLLDLPGVTNSPLGEELSEEKKIDFSKSANPMADFSDRLYKLGKTLSIVYGQAKTCSIDAFVLFVSIGGKPFQAPGRIDEGITAWLEPFGGLSNGRPPLPFYVNLSLIDKALPSNISLMGGRELANYYTARVDIFESARFAEHFFTSNIYNRYDNPEGHKALSLLAEDVTFKGILRGKVASNSLAALREDGTGGDYMLQELSCISADKRLGKYRDIERDDFQNLLGAIRPALPPQLGGEDALRRQIVDYAYSQATCRTTDVHELARLIKKLLRIEPGMFDPLPMDLRRDKKRINGYLQKAFNDWVAAQTVFLKREGVDIFLLKNPASETKIFLDILSCVNLADIQDNVIRNFAFVRDAESAMAARYPMAHVLGNLILYGSISPRHESALDGYRADPGRWSEVSTPDMLLTGAFVHRLEDLKASGRFSRQETTFRPRMVGDEELETIEADIRKGM